MCTVELVPVMVGASSGASSRVDGWKRMRGSGDEGDNPDWDIITLLRRSLGELGVRGTLLRRLRGKEALLEEEADATLFLEMAESE